MAIANKTGYCTEHAALTYILLRDELESKYKIYYGKSGKAHWFCMISELDFDKNPGDYISNNELDLIGEKVIVVDPWPPHAVAMTWAHSNYKYGYPNFRLLKKSSGTVNKRSTKLAHAISKFQSHQIQRERQITLLVNSVIREIELAAESSPKLAETLANEYIEELKQKGDISMYDILGDTIYYARKKL